VTRRGLLRLFPLALVAPAAATTVVTKGAPVSPPQFGQSVVTRLDYVDDLWRLGVISREQMIAMLALPEARP
jgi:hypothetical protein